MADPLSITASIAAVLQLASAVVGYVKDVHGGADDRVRLRDSIWSTISLLEMLNARFEDAESEEADVPLRYKMDVKTALKELQRALETLVSKLAPASRLKKVMQKVAWPFDKKEIQELLTCIESQKSFFGLALQNDHMRLTQSLKSDLREVSQGIGELLIDQTQHLEQLRSGYEQELIDWISPIRFWEKQLDIEDARVPGTSEWIIINPPFVDWLKRDSGNLWCPGIPGAGKTVIASVIINHLLNLQQAMPELRMGVAFIYCNYKEQEQQTMLNLLSSILHQLALKAPEISQTLMDAFKEHEKKKIRLPTRWVVKAMSDIISKYGPVYLVIDALDECTDSDGRRTDLMASLKKMPENLKILCTSRELPDIKQNFREASEVCIYARDSDVEKYLTGQIDKSVRLKKHCKADPSLLRAIIDTVVDRVDGMFLLAQLHVEILSKKQDRRSVRRALEILPTTLDDTYDQTLRRIQSQDADDVALAQSVLYWISFAVRPLTIWELRCAIAAGNLDPTEEDLDDESYVDEEVLIDVCAGIVTTDKESDAIRLVHYSTQEYFERNRQKIFPNAQRQISRTCLRYLSLNAFSKPSQHWGAVIERQDNNHLFEYASTHWGHHAVESPEQEVLEDIFEFFKLHSNLQNSAQCLVGPPSYRVLMDLSGRDLSLWVSSRFGLVDATRRLVLEGADINVRIQTWSRTSGKSSALRNAITLGHSEITQILLDHGAILNNADLKDSLSKTDVQESLLALAAFNGHLPILKILLGKGYDIHAQDQVHGSALAAAVSGRWVESCKYLIEFGASLEDWTRPHGTILGQAVAQYRGVSQTESQESGTDLHPRKGGATRKLDADQDVGMAVTRLLLDAGANVDAKNAQGEYILLVAAFLRYPHLVKVLLEFGASPNAKDWLGRTLLHFPIIPQIAELFIDSKADVNVTSTSGETPLHHAAALGKISSAMLFLDHGANINVASSEGYTPLDKALMHGQETAWLEKLGAIAGPSPLSARNLLASDSTGQPRILKSMRLETRAVLDDLEGEAWNAEFSNDGKQLATYGDSGALAIYQTEGFLLLKTLSDGPSPLSDLSWSSDNSKILTGSTDKHARLWDVANGILLAKLPRFGEGLYDCLWVPGRPEFVTCCMDMSMGLCLWSMDGSLLHDFEVGQRVMGCAIAPESGNIIAFGRESLYVYHLKTFQLLVKKDLDVYGCEHTGCSMSLGSPYALLQIKGKLLIIGLETLEIVEIFEKEDETQFVIKSSFGGAQNKYVACGSESGHIYLWDWQTRDLICKTKAKRPNTSNSAGFELNRELPLQETYSTTYIATKTPPENEKSACCNSVSWHPTIPNMLVSASDDGTVIVWNLIEDHNE